MPHDEYDHLRESADADQRRIATHLPAGAKDLADELIAIQGLSSDALDIAQEIPDEELRNEVITIIEEKIADTGSDQGF